MVKVEGAEYIVECGTCSVSVNTVKFRKWLFAYKVAVLPDCRQAQIR